MKGGSAMCKPIEDETIEMTLGELKEFTSNMPDGVMLEVEFGEEGDENE